MNARLKSTLALVVGGEPRADLLPPEIHARHRDRVFHRVLIGAVLLSLVVVGAGYVGAMFLANQSGVALAAEQERTQDLLAQQQKYADARHASLLVDTALAARRIGMSTEIDWKGYLGKIQAALPTGSSVVSYAVDSVTPLDQYAQATVPLQKARVAKITVQMSSMNLPDIHTWLNALPGLPGFVDATPGSITLEETKGTYLATVAIHIDQNAFSDRFATTGANK